MSFRQKLTETEEWMALAMGSGLALIILAFMLGASQAGSSTFSSASLNILLGVGGTLAVVGFIAWLALVQPWKNFDDWSTPLYTGHDDYEHQEPGAHAAAQPATLDALPGINTKILKALHSAGVTDLGRLAAHSPAELERIVRDSGARLRVGSAARWIEQAKSAPQSKGH